MSGDKPEECFADVGLYVSAVGRVEPDYLSFLNLQYIYFLLRYTNTTVLSCLIKISVTASLSRQDVTRRAAFKTDGFPSVKSVDVKGSLKSISVISD